MEMSTNQIPKTEGNNISPYVKKVIKIKYEPTLRVGYDSRKPSDIIINAFDTNVISHDEKNGIITMEIESKPARMDSFISERMNVINAKMPIGEIIQ